VKNPVGLAVRYEGHIKDKHAMDLLQKMLEMDPDKRITARQALEHPYFQDCRAKDLSAGQPMVREHKVHLLDLIDSVADSHQPRDASPPRQPAEDFRGSAEAKPKYSRTQDLISKLNEEARDSQGSTAKTYYNVGNSLVGPAKQLAPAKPLPVYARAFDPDDKPLKYK